MGGTFRIAHLTALVKPKNVPLGVCSLADALFIRDWDRLYENSRSRQIEHDLRWVAIPNKHDSFGFRCLITRPNGLALYGAWCLIVQVASKCKPRGSLIKSGIPLNAQLIASLTGAAVEGIEECLRVVQEPQINWIESLPSGGCQAGDGQPSGGCQAGDGQPSGGCQAGGTGVSVACPSRAREIPSVLSFPSFSSEGGPGETLVGECAERMYALHPKKKNLVLVPFALLSAVNGTGDVQKFLIEVETCHAAHCETEDWKKCGGRYAPPLDVWIADRGFTKWPEGKAPKVLQEWKPGMPFRPGMTVDPSLIKPWNPFEGLPTTDAGSGEKK